MGCQETAPLGAQRNAGAHDVQQMSRQVGAGCTLFWLRQQLMIISSVVSGSTDILLIAMHAKVF